MMRKSLLIMALAFGFFMIGCNVAKGASEKTPTGNVLVTGTSTLTATLLASETPTPTATLLFTETPTLETPTPQETLTNVVGDMVSTCGLTPIVVPTAAAYPGANQLDETTNLHMTGHAVKIDVTSYRLKVTGMVDHPLSLSYDELRCMPKVTARLPLICPGYFEDVATWAGVPLNYVLNLAGVKSGAKMITLMAADKYESQVALETALQEGNFLAYEWEGEPLPILHGFPLRAVFPAIEGNKWVKWLLEIEVE